ncbi:MAG: DM13 domain-containing protein [Chloroflexota bacterium]
MLLSIFTDLGRSEEFFSEVVYPVWPLWLAGAIAVLAAITWLAYRRGWVRTAASHPLLTGATAAVIIGVAAYPAYYTVSPLFERSTVCEASPIAGAGVGSEDCAGIALAATMPPSAAPTLAPAIETDAPTAVATAAPATTVAPTEAPFAAHTVRNGTWQSADDFHYTIGDALLIESAPDTYTLRFENFSVRNGPDVYVLLSTTNDYAGETLNLGSLKGTDGAFNYDVPAGTDVARYKSAIIWCKQFDVLFGHAELT